MHRAESARDVRLAALVVCAGVLLSAGYSAYELLLHPSEGGFVRAVVGPILVFTVVGAIVGGLSAREVLSGQRSPVGEVVACVLGGVFVGGNVGAVFAGTMFLAVAALEILCSVL